MEMAVAIPALIIVAALSFGTLSFMGDCTAFDREFRNAVRIYAESPESNTDCYDAARNIEDYLAVVTEDENTHVSVSIFNSSETTVYTATLTRSPTLFGKGIRTEIFGVTIPAITHSDSLAIDGFGNEVTVKRTAR